MALEYLAGQIKAIRDQAAKEQAAIGRVIKNVDEDPALTDEGKRPRKAEHLDAIKSTLRELRAREEALIDSEIVTRERQLFMRTDTTAEEMRNFRDAQERAEKLATVDEAKPLLHRAFRSDDRDLAFAVFRVSLDRNWREPIASFTAENPEMAEIAQDLAGLQRAKENSMQRTMHYAAWGA